MLRNVLPSLSNQLIALFGKTSLAAVHTGTDISGAQDQRGNVSDHRDLACRKRHVCRHQLRQRTYFASWNDAWLLRGNMAPPIFLRFSGSHGRLLAQWVGGLSPRCLGSALGAIVGLSLTYSGWVFRSVSRCYTDFIRGTPVLQVSYPRVFLRIERRRARSWTDDGWNARALHVLLSPTSPKWFAARSRRSRKSQTEAAKAIGLTSIHVFWDVLAPGFFARSCRCGSTLPPRSSSYRRWCPSSSVADLLLKTQGNHLQDLPEPAILSARRFHLFPDQFRDRARRSISGTQDRIAGLRI